jgi:hypothetical protein
MRSTATTAIRLAVFLALAVFTSSTVSAEPTASLTVTVYDYANTPPALLRQAEAVAGHVVAKAGVELTFEDCPTVEGGKQNRVCRLGTDAGIVMLKILPAAMSDRLATDLNQFGIALVPATGIGSVFYLFSDRVQALVAESKIDAAQVMGHVMAHELGHLLLGSNAHALHGIMQAKWGHDELGKLARGNLRFDASQAQRISANCPRRPLSNTLAMH